MLVQILERARLAGAKRVLGMSARERVAVVTAGGTERVTLRLQRRHLARAIVQLALFFSEPLELDAGLLKLVHDPARVDADAPYVRFDEAVEQIELKARRRRDLFEVVVAVDVGAEHSVAIERHIRRRAALVEDVKRLVAAPLADVRDAVFRRHAELHPARAEVVLHERPQRRVTRHRRAIEQVAHHRERRRLAAAADADDHVQAVGEVERDAFEEAVAHGERADQVVGRSGGLRLLRRRVVREHGSFGPPDGFIGTRGAWLREIDRLGL